MPVPQDPASPPSSSSPRKPWTAPKLESVDVAERTNKKTLSPSDGSGTHDMFS